MNSIKNVNVAIHVVWFLGVIGIILSAGMVWLTWSGANIDGGLSTLAGTAVGALGAILTQTRTQNQRETDSEQPVEVTATEPLPVEISDEEPDNSAANAGPKNLSKTVLKQP